MELGNRKLANRQFFITLTNFNCCYINISALNAVENRKGRLKMSERQKALLWRIPLLTVIIYSIVQKFIPNMQNRVAIALLLMLYAFDVVFAVIVLFFYDGKFQKWMESTSRYLRGIYKLFALAALFGTSISVFVVLQLTNSLFWTLLFAALIPYVVVVIFTIFYFAFACDKR